MKEQEKNDKTLKRGLLPRNSWRRQNKKRTMKEHEKDNERTRKEQENNNERTRKEQ